MLNGKTNEEDAMEQRTEYRVSAYGLVDDGEGQFLLLKRSSNSTCFAGQWQMPGGKPDPGETIDQALRREIEEESGIDVTITGLAGCVDFELPDFKVVMIVFRCHADATTIILSREHEDHRWASPEQMLRMNLTEHDHRFLQGYLPREHNVS